MVFGAKHYSISKMDIKEAILKRKSVRRFSSTKDVNDFVLKTILELGIRAPSAGNHQPWKIIVVRNLKIKKKLAEAAYNQDFIAAAPVVLIICIEEGRASVGYGQRGIELYSIQDTAALIENILLAVVDSNLGACWVGAFDEESCRKIESVPENVRPIAIIPIGYEAGNTTTTRRRSLEEVVIWD